MKICYNTHADNSIKPALMPSAAPFIVYKVDDTFMCPEGFTEVTLEAFDAYKASIDMTAYEAEVRKSNIQSVTPRQIRLALLQMGISMSTIDSALNSLSEPTRSQAIVEWDHASYFERTWPLVGSVAAILGWTDSQLDDLWILAATL